MPFLFPVFVTIVGIYFGFDLYTLEGIFYSIASSVGIIVAVFALIAAAFYIVEGDNSHA